MFIVASKSEPAPDAEKFEPIYISKIWFYKLN